MDFSTWEKHCTNSGVFLAHSEGNAGCLLDAEKYDKHNQYTNRDADNVPFCFSDYTLVKDSNKILTANGQNALVTSLKWNPAKLIATFEYKINEVHSNNFKTFITIPDGK